MIVLKNEWLEAAISEAGAELKQLSHHDGTQYLWSGDPRWWGKTSPVLFPIVGTLKENAYQFEGKWYSLPRHGFARDRIFAPDIFSPSAASFTLVSDDDTKAVYPFDFKLVLKYELVESSLLLTYEVVNTGESVMYFSIGGHPAFALPFETGLSYNEYYLEFEKDEPLLRYKLENGLISSSTELVSTLGNKLMLDPALFYEDAIVLMNLESTYVTLTAGRASRGIRFHFDGFPYLGIWAAKDAPFICIEPWCGHADTISHNQILQDKPGIEALEAGASWCRTWSVTCF